MIISIMITNMVRKKARTEMADEENPLASFLESQSFCDTIGTKAEVKAPSANRLRNRLGSLKLTKKASEIIPAPRYLARTMSRRKPVILLRKVKLPKVAIDLKSDIFVSFAKKSLCC
jgi:hypothetical protein